MTDPVPADVMGLWRREVITAPGFRDETTQVVWLQTQRVYADLRVRADRPDSRETQGFSAYSDEDLVGLAQTQGFAGELVAGDGVCFWRRDMDCQPPGPVPDEARYAIEDEVLIEDGIHADYQEIWRRDPDSKGPIAAFTLSRSDGREGLLVLAGERMMEFIGRAGPSPIGESLAELVAAALVRGEREWAEALLSTQIRYCVLEDGGWRTTLSSLPWLEGQAPWSATPGLDPQTGALAYTDQGLGVTGRLLDASTSPEEIARLLGAVRIEEAAL